MTPLAQRILTDAQRVADLVTAHDLHPEYVSLCANSAPWVSLTPAELRARFAGHEAKVKRGAYSVTHELVVDGIRVRAVEYVTASATAPESVTL